MNVLHFKLKIRRIAMESATMAFTNMRTDSSCYSLINPRIPNVSLTLIHIKEWKKSNDCYWLYNLQAV